MKPFVYAIYSHINPDQVLRLARTLRALSPNAHIVIHHDPQYSTLDPTAAAATGAILIPRPIQGEWGDFSQVHQHLHVLRWCHDNLDFEWLITLTGQSYPIKPLAAFEALLRSSPADAYLTYFDAYDPAVWPIGEAERRYHYRYWKLPRFRYWHRVPESIRSRVSGWILQFNQAQPWIRLFTFPRGLPTRLGVQTQRRPFGPGQMPLEGANQNTNFRYTAVHSILEFTQTNPDYSQYFSRTALPDEVFFATILRGQPDLYLINDNFRHIYWPAERAASGGTLTMAHLISLMESPAYFALKFDQDKHPELLDAIDRHIMAT